MINKQKKQSRFAKGVKKVTAVLLAALMTASVGSAAVVSVGAVESTAVSSGGIYGDYGYAVLDDGTVKITDYYGSDAEIVIPSEIDGKSVTSIGLYAFDGTENIACESLESVTIPNSVTTIEPYAFSGCENLKSITIPDSVTSIGAWAFFNTAWYDSQPDGLVYAGKVAYKYKGEMPENTEVVLKDGTLGIATNAFEYCLGLTSVTIPDGVTSIGIYAFACCENLKSVTIPDSVKTIGRCAIGYFVVPFSTAPPIKYDNFTITGYKGTAAEQYAIDNGFEFIVLEPITVPGDVNGDGKVTLTDAINIQKASLSMIELSGQALKNADLNGDGVISVFDAIIAQKIALQMNV